MSTTIQEQDTVPKTQNRFVDRYTEMLWNHPDNQEFVGPGKLFETRADLTQWLLKHNDKKPWMGEICGKKEQGILIPGRELNVPAGFVFKELEREIACVAVPLPPLREREVHTGGAAPVPATPAPVAVAAVTPHYYIRQDAPSQDGARWPVGSHMHALEALARSGLNPEFTKQYYALKNVAARHAVVLAEDSGEVGGSVNGIPNGDHLIEGKRRFGEDAQSDKDNTTTRRRRGTTGSRTAPGAAIDGPRQHLVVVGHADTIDKEGAYIRNESMGGIEFAHGGNYGYRLFGVNIPFGNMLGLPVGAIGTSPREQVALDAETRRWGLSTATPAQAIVNEAGFNNLFRDQQTTLAGPMESPDRIYAYMYGLNAKQTFLESMRKFDATTDPQQRQNHAAMALIAYRDLQNNAIVKQVDAYRMPMEESLAGVKRYFTAQGVDVKAAESAAVAAPQLKIVDMPQAQLEQLQDYKILKDTRYGGIKQGEGNAAYDQSMHYAYRTQNMFELMLARNEVTPVPEAELIQRNHAAAIAIAVQPEASTRFARSLRENPNLQVQVTNLLHDIKRHPEDYGFSNKEKSDVFLTQILGEKGKDNAVRADVENNGATGILPFIGSDDPFGKARPDLVGQQVARVLEAQPHNALLIELLGKATDPTLGVDSETGRTDGRRYGIGILRSYAAEMLRDANAKDGDMPYGYRNMVAGMSAEDKALVTNAIAQSAIHAENGQSNVNVQGRERADNDYTRLQHAVRGQQVALGAPGANAAALDDAGARGDVAAAFTALLRNDDVVKIGATGAVVSGFTAQLDLGLDVMVVTLGREHTAYNDVRDRLDELDDAYPGTFGSPYKTLSNVLGRASKAVKESKALEVEAATLRAAADAETNPKKAAKLRAKAEKAAYKAPKEMEEAVQQLAGFMADIKANPGSDEAKEKLNALNAFWVAVGKDANASLWTVNAVTPDATLTTAVLKAVPSMLAAADGLRVGHGTPGTGETEPYESRFYTFARDKKNRIVDRGLFRTGIDKIAVDVQTVKDIALAPVADSDAARGTPSRAALPTIDAAKIAATGLLASGVTNTPNALSDALGASPVVYDPFYNKPLNGQPQSVVLAKYLEQQGKPLPAGMTYAQLAADAIAAGIVKVEVASGNMTMALNTAALNETLAQGGNLNAGSGIAAWWLLLPFLPGGGKDNPLTNPGSIPNCPQCERPPIPVRG